MIDKIKDELGYDRPIYEQYVDYLGDIVRGDLGVDDTDRRAVTRHRPRQRRWRRSS